jgi:iron complex outermembrane receptor protein
MLTVISVLSACVAAASPQGALTLRVRDPQGAPVADARATLRSPTGEWVGAAATNQEGLCRFGGLATGEYLIGVEASGFLRSEARRVRVGVETSADLDVDLSLAGFNEQLVVTATGNAQTVDEVSKSLTVVDHREMDARGDVSVADALRSVAGVRVQQLGGPGAATNINIRGMRIADTAVLIDGVRFRDPTGTQGDASVFIQTLALTDLERIEVMRGSGSSLYGSNAIGGVVNLLTAEGGGSLRGGLLFEGGSLGALRGRANVTGGLAEDRVTYSLGLTRLDVSKGVDGDDAADNTSGQGRAHLRISSNAGLVVRLYGANASTYLNATPRTVGTLPRGVVDAVPLSPAELVRYEGGTPVSQLRLGDSNFIPSADDPDDRRESTFRSALLRFEQRANSRLGYSVSYHRLTTERVFLDGPRGVSSFEPRAMTRSEFSGTTHTLTGRADASLADHHFVTGGYEFESETFDNRSFPDDPSGNSSVDVTQTSHAVFVQDQMRFVGGRLQVAGSARAQFFHLQTPRFEPTNSAPYQSLAADPPTAYTADGSLAYSFPSSGTLLRAHVGTGYRAPSLFERFGSGFSTFGYTLFGDPRLGPERSLGVDAGVDRALARGRLRLSATYFRTRLRDAIIFDSSGAIRPDTDPFARSSGYRSAGSGLASGVELTAAATPFPAANVSAAYTFVDSQPPTGIPDAPRALGIPRHQFSLVALVGLDRNVTASLQLVAMSDVLSRIGSRILRFDGTIRADAQMKYRLPLGSKRPFGLFGRVENALDRMYFENGFRTPGRTVIGGGTLVF